MKILSSTQYDALIEVAREAQKTIDSLRSEIVVYDAIVKKLQKENECLKTILKKTNLSSIYGVTITDIDFPNSKTGCEDKII